MDDSFAKTIYNLNFSYKDNLKFKCIFYQNYEVCNDYKISYVVYKIYNIL